MFLFYKITSSKSLAISIFLKCFFASCKSSFNL